MTKEEFINKWRLQSAKGYGSALFDCSELLKQDLELVIKNLNSDPSDKVRDELIRFSDWFQENYSHKYDNIRYFIDKYLENQSIPANRIEP